MFFQFRSILRRICRGSSTSLKKLIHTVELEMTVVTAFILLYICTLPWRFRICPSRFVRFYTRSRNLDVCQNFKDFVINIFEIRLSLVFKIKKRRKNSCRIVHQNNCVRYKAPIFPKNTHSEFIDRDFLEIYVC